MTVHDGELKSSGWQDWTLFGLRFAFLFFAGLALFLSRQPDGQSYPGSEILTALVVGTLATVVISVPMILPSLGKYLPYVVIITDWIVAAIFAYVSRGEPILVILCGGLLIAASTLRLGPLWGTVDAIGVVISMFVALSIHFGYDGVNIALDREALPLTIVAMFAFVAVIWSFVLNRQLGQQARQIQDINDARKSQLTDMRERTRAIYDMAATLSATLNYEKIVRAAMSAGYLGLRHIDRRGTERLASMVMLFRADDKQLHVVAQRGLTRTDEQRLTPGREGVIGETLTEAIPIIRVGNFKHDPELGNFVAFQTARSVLCIPLRAGFVSFGIMVYGSERTDAFTEEHTELLTSIGTQATIALQNSLLYRDLREERDRIVQVEEEARKKLARDLHDGPTQAVAAIAMRMNVIQKLLERTPSEVPDELRKIEDIARRTTKEIRHMLFTLRPLVLENQGLIAALEQLAEKMKDTYSQTVSVRADKEAVALLDTRDQGTLFYVVEEAVNNARKHAQAELITITIARQDDFIWTNVSDNGVGFDTRIVDSSYDKRGSLGMVNLRERTQLLGGTINIESQVGRGTSVTVLIPVKETVG